MGKHSSGSNAAAWSRGVVAAGLVVVGACGSRNALPGGLVVDDDTTNAGFGSGGPGTTGGPSGVTHTAVGQAAGQVSGQAVTVTVGAAVTTGGSFVGGPTSGLTTGVIPTTSTGGGSIGVGGSPSCYPDSAGGQGGEAGAPSEVEQCPIPYCDGWAPADANCANIQGSFYLFHDQESGGSSTIYAAPGTGGNQICVAGYVNQVLGSQYDVYWGAGFGMSLNQPAIDQAPEPYDAEAASVVGFGFYVNALPYGELRFTVRGEDFYCTQVLSTGYSEYLLADLTKGCWELDSTPHDYSGLMSIEWHFVSNGQTSYDFSVCMSNLTVYRGPG